MSIYQGRHAELYDLFNSQKSYAGEAAFVHDLLQQCARGPARRLIDIACGTGSHAFELEKRGYEIVATDISDDMLACARAKATKAFSRVRFARQDMRELDLSEADFDAALCLFDAIGHVLTSGAIKETFASVRRQLRPQGLLILEFWHAAAFVSKYEPLRVRRFRSADGEILRISETTLDLAQQYASVQHAIYEHRSNGTYTFSIEKQVNRFFSLPEMRDLLEQSGFAVVKTFAGYSNNETLTSDTWHIVLAAQRRES